MSAHDVPGGLPEQLAGLFVRFDPLEPWLTESHYDDSYWDKEALELAGRMTGDMSLSDVSAALLSVLAETFPGSRADEGLLRGDHLDALSEACWHLLRQGVL